jgi:Cu+-exporting ATPase
MKVDPATAKFSSVREGKTSYFCSAGCKKKFDAPVVLTQIAIKPAAVPKGVEYTCPMDPEVRQMGPGSCPVCGMALEPVEITTAPEADHELAEMTRRFWICAGLSVPLLGGMFVHADWLRWAQLLLSSPVVLF